MEIEGYCHQCLKWFDAHWHNVPAKHHLRFILKPWCLDCKTHNIHTITDESLKWESPNGDDYETLGELK